MNTEKFKEISESITLHGLGFIQIKLQGRQRLHVWHPELPRRKCFEHSAIHDHRFSFTSRVMIGAQKNQYWQAMPWKGEETHDAYLHEGERMSCGGRPWIHSGQYALEKKRGLEVIRAGEEYHVAEYNMHSTESDGIVITLMTKRYEYPKGARSFCEIGVEPDANFDRYQLSESELWDVVADAFVSGYSS